MKNPVNQRTGLLQSQIENWHLLLSSGLMANHLHQVTVGNGLKPFRPLSRLAGLSAHVAASPPVGNCTPPRS